MSVPVLMPHKYCTGRVALPQDKFKTYGNLHEQHFDAEVDPHQDLLRDMVSGSCFAE
jgi:hypothetical protein